MSPRCTLSILMCSVSDNKRSRQNKLQLLPWKGNAIIAQIGFLCGEREGKKKGSGECRAARHSRAPPSDLYSLMPF